MRYFAVKNTIAKNFTLSLKKPYFVFNILIDLSSTDMTQKSPIYLLNLFVGALCLSIVISSCGKKNNTDSSAPIANIGLYEFASTDATTGTIYKRLFMPISAIGTQTPTNNPTEIPEYTIFDTGSTGITMDASGLIPASMITSSGITMTGDSVVVNGITIINQMQTVSFGDATASTKEYGYLAYTNFTLGEVGSAQVNTGRIPFFLYYKVVDQNGKAYGVHQADVFGVGSGVSYASSKIASPLSYITSSNATTGFKLGLTTASGFNASGTFIPALLTIGLTQTDLSTAGFIMHPLSSFSVGGYSDNIPATITYNGTVVSSAQILFDTGTPAYTVIEDPKATGIGNLAANSTVTVTTNKGFTFNYKVGANGNLTTIQNPNNTQDYRSVFSLDFFATNEYLVDYRNHQIGLKNN